MPTTKTKTKRKADETIIDDENEKKKQKQELLEKFKKEAEANRALAAARKLSTKASPKTSQRRKTIDPSEITVLGNNGKTGNGKKSKGVKRESLPEPAKPLRRRQTINPTQTVQRRQSAGSRIRTPKKEKTVEEQLQETDDGAVIERHLTFFENAIKEAEENRRNATKEVAKNKVLVPHDDDEAKGDTSRGSGARTAKNGVPGVGSCDDELSIPSEIPSSVSLEELLISATSFLLGFLSVVGVYFVLITYSLPVPFSDYSGTEIGRFFSGLFAQAVSLGVRASQIVVALVLICGVIKGILWYKFRRDNRSHVTREMAKIAKSLIREKVRGICPSDFIMEEVLEECGELSLYGAKINRSTMKSMWSAVEDILLEDSRLQISDQIFEGKKRRCLRYMGLASVLASQ